MPSHPFAAFGPRLMTDLVDVTGDVAALDGHGAWAVVLPADAPPVLARFAALRSRPARLGTGAWPGVPPAAWRSSLDREGFQAGVRAIREGIAAGEVYQVNLTRRLRAPLPPGADLGDLGDALAASHPAPFAAVVHLPGQGTLVASASPECFLGRDGAVVRSSPIKGTAATADGFLPKDAAENVMIVDLVRNDLGRVCEVGSVEVPALCRAEAHPGLHHLVSTVSGRLRRGAGWPHLLEATFPPGSVTGAPKLAALRWIDRLEPVPRGIYCGAVGWVDADRGVGELAVAIRTFWVEDGHLHLGTGGGITWESDPAGEWAETELKAHRLLAAVAPDPAGQGGRVRR